MSWTPWIGLEPINNVGIQFLGDPGKRLSRMSNDHRAASVGSNTMIQLIGRYPCTFAHSPLSPSEDEFWTYGRFSFLSSFWFLTFVFKLRALTEKIISKLYSQRIF